MNPAYERVLQYFDYRHLKGDLREVSKKCCMLAFGLLEKLPDNHAEVTVGLRHLLEAKDCFVRALLPQDQVSEKLDDIRKDLE